nr:DUF285 domain-containing protein [Saccharofermentans sp.]
MRKISGKLKKSSKKGITLVELVVAITMTAIFAVACIALINPIERMYQGTVKLTKAQLLADTVVDAIRKECDDVKHDDKTAVWIANFNEGAADDAQLLSVGPDETLKKDKGNALIFQRNNNYTEAIYSCVPISETNRDNVKDAANPIAGDNTGHSIITLFGSDAANQNKGIVHFGYYQSKDDDRGVFPIRPYDYTNPVTASTYGNFTVKLEFSNLTLKDGKYPTYVNCKISVYEGMYDDASVNLKGPVYTRSTVISFSANGSGNGSGGSYKPVTDKDISVTIRWLNINDEVVAWPSSVPSVSVVLTDDGIVKGQYNAIRDQKKFVFASVKVKGKVKVTPEGVTGYEYGVTAKTYKDFVITYKIAKNDTVKLVSGKTFLNIMGKNVSYVIFDSFANHSEFAKGTGSKVAININQINNDNNRRPDYELFKSTDGDGKVTAYILSDDGTFIANENCESMFDGCTKLENITGLTGVDTYRTTNMKAMFKNCKIMNQFYLPGFVKAACRTTESMFENCYSVTSVNLSGWDTSNVTTMKNMFFHFHCYFTAESLGTNEPMTVDLSDFDFENCTTLENFFGVSKGDLYKDVYDPCNITRIMLPVKADCTKVTTMKFMFKGVNGLTDIENLATMKTSTLLTNTWGMFSRVNIEEINLSAMVLSEVTDAHYMFDRNYALKRIIINGKSSDSTSGDFRFELPECKNMNSIFERCSGLERFNGELIAPKCTDFQLAFNECTSLETFSGELDLRICPSISTAFNNCTSLIEVNLSKYNLTSCTNASSLFANCTSLKKFILEGKKSDVPVNSEPSALLEFNLPVCTNANSMFKNTAFETFSGKLNFPECTSFSESFNGCSKLSSVNLSESDLGKCNEFKDLFTNCPALATIKMERINLNSTTGLGFLAYNPVRRLYLNGAKLHSLASLECWYKNRNLEELYFSNVTLDSCKSTKEMLSLCSNLNTVIMNGFKTPECTNMTDMFSNCSSVETIELNEWDTSKVTTMHGMFFNFHRGFTNSDTGTKSELVLDISSFDLTDKLTDMAYMFAADDNNNLVRNITNIVLPDTNDTNTSSVTDMTALFNNCTGLKEITNLDKLSGASNRSAKHVFRHCYDLENISLAEGFVSSACTTCEGMFDSCYSVRNGNFINNWDTSNVQAMDWMFYMFHASYNSRGTTDEIALLDLRDLDFNSCTNLEKMFASVENSNVVRKIHTIVFPADSNMCAVTTMKDMFFYCKGVRIIQGLNDADLSSVTTVERIFSNCTELETLDLSGIDWRSCTNTGYIFTNCSSLTSINMRGVNFEKLTSMKDFFQNCVSLTDADLSWINIPKCTDMTYCFNNCTSLTTVNLSNIVFTDNKNVNFGYFFNSCKGLTSLDISGTDLSAVSNADYMFNSCSALKSLNMSGINLSNCTSMENFFANCGSLNSLNLSGADLSSMTSINFINSAANIAVLDISGADLTGLTTLKEAFSGKTSLQSVDFS